MSRTITAPVGNGSPNRPDDVRNIQQLINNVPEQEGGLREDRKLVVDGLCGPNTKDAIAKFQVKHFGWSGADGKVEPGKQTLAKLNSFDTSVTPPPSPPPKPQPKSKQFLLQFVNKGNLIGHFMKDRFILATLVPTQEQAIYWLGTPDPPSPVPTKFEGVGSLMKTAQERSVDQLVGIDFYKSESDGKSVKSEMVMTMGQEVVRTQMNAHFVEAKSKAQSMFGAELKLVKTGVQIF
jgi:hypothetical protein